MAASFDRTAFQAVIQSIVDESVSVYWATDAEPGLGDIRRNRLELEVFSSEGVGQDERRVLLGPDGYAPTDLVTVQLGNRIIRINFKARIYDTALEASELLDHIRTAIRGKGVHGRVFATGLAFVDSSSTINVRLVEDNRRVNCAAMDITFGAVARVVSTVEHNEGWIDTVSPLPQGTFSQ